MPYLAFSECIRLGLLPGGILSGEFNFSKHRTAPHVEDSNYSNLTYEGPCSGEEFRKILKRSCSKSLEAGFGVAPPEGEKVIPPMHTGARSIVTLEVAPSDVEIVENRYKPGSIRLHFRDPAGRKFRFLPITDLGFYDYAQRHRESSAMEALNNEISAQDQVFLRIGLSRSHKSPQGKEGYWLQANGIYTFPTVLRYIRSYPPTPSAKS
jgi:hypothetical protein